MRHGLLRLRRRSLFPHLLPDLRLFPVRPSRPPHVASFEEDLREDQDAYRLPESDCRQLEDRGHEPVPEPHGYSPEEREERGNENNRRRCNYPKPCSAGPLGPSLVAPFAVFMIQHRMPPISKSIVHPILKRSGELADCITLPRHERIDRDARRLSELTEGNPAESLRADHLALRRGQGLDSHFEGDEHLVSLELVQRVKPGLGAYLLDDLPGQLDRSGPLPCAPAPPQVNQAVPHRGEDPRCEVLHRGEGVHVAKRADEGVLQDVLSRRRVRRMAPRPCEEAPTTLEVCPLDRLPRCRRALSFAFAHCLHQYRRLRRRYRVGQSKFLSPTGADASSVQILDTVCTARGLLCSWYLLLEGEMELLSRSRLVQRNGFS